VCFFGPNFTKFQPKKYDLNLYKGFTQGKKMAQICQILKGKKNAICQICMISSSKFCGDKKKMDNFFLGEFLLMCAKFLEFLAKF
jgi:hypothetical protein